VRVIWRVVTLVVVVALLATAGFVAWDRWWRRAGPANPGVTCPAVVSAHHRLPFTAIGVHRVALIGDSIMEQASCAIADSLSDAGIETFRHAVIGSGLLTGMDWLAATRQILRSDRPDVVVAIFVGNYYPPPLHDASGKPIEADTPAFYTAWQHRAELLSAEIHAAHARLYWVSPPPITISPLERAARLFDGYRTIQGDHFLFSGRVLAGPHGSEVIAKQTCGTRRAVRVSDGVHLTYDGGRIYGEQIAHDLTADLGILTTPQPC
jgi:hypothetical protein